MGSKNQNPIVSDEDFITLYPQLGPHALARRTGQDVRVVYQRRQRLEEKLKIQITLDDPRSIARPEQFPHRAFLEIKNGVVLIGSDAHIWPGPRSTGMRAFVAFCKELKPKVVILNGDMMDFPQISKHDPIGWESWPTVQEEIEATQDALDDVAKAAGRAEKIWTLGNHDARFEKRLAIAAPEYARVAGLHLRDHFPLWRPCWSAWINDQADTVVVKHRFKGGDHAPYNNVIKGGTHMVTAHLHSAKIMPFTNAIQTLYGVDDGCLADVNHKAFVNYTEDSPKNWRSAFCVLTFANGRLLQPQLALVHDEKHVDYCGELIAV